MTGHGTSVLLISPDAAVNDAVTRALQGVEGAKLRTETKPLSAINGDAVKLAADPDIIIIEAGASDDAELETIRALARARHAGARLVALADGDMTLSQVRALNEVGVDEVMPAPLAERELSRKILAPQPAAAMALPAVRAPGRLIAVAQARGGIGATTVTVNLANELVGHKSLLRAYRPNAVALVDLDVQFGSVGSMLDIAEHDELMQLALDGAMPDDDFLADALVRMPNGLAVLPAPSKFMPLDSLTPEQISRLIDLLRRDADFVLVDLPHALGSWVEPVLKQADELLIVSDTSVPAIRHCRRLIDFFLADNPELKIRIVINHETRGLFPTGVQKEAQRALDRKLDIWLPHDARAARIATDRGKPLSKVAPSSPLTKAISRLARTTLAEFPVSRQAHAREQ